jgi:putative membrane protein
MGFVLLGVLIRQVGIREVIDHLRRLGWFSPLILLPYGVEAIFNAKGWACALQTSEGGCPVPLHRLYFTRIAGEAVNNLTPAASVGGEPIKVYLLKTLGVPTERGLASVVIAKTALTTGQIVFILVGLPFFLYRLELFQQSAIVFLPLLGLAYLFVVLLIRFQKKGLLTLCIRGLNRLLPRRVQMERWQQQAQGIDAHLLEFYDTNPRSFFASTLYHLIGWLMGAVEVALILFLLDVPFRPTDPLIIESMVQPLTVAALLIPGALGVQEAGGVILCKLLGIGESVGLALMVLKRVREATYNLMGLFVLMCLGNARKSSHPSGDLI